jgi:hypothetical protein
VSAPRREEIALVHPTYRHLDRPVRVAGVTLAHWTALTGAALTAYALWKLLPLPPTTALSVAVTICGVPIAASFAAGENRAELVDLLLAHARGAGTVTRYPPGSTPGLATGRRLSADAAPVRHREAREC